MDQGAVSEGVFSMKLASSGSELYIGGTNSRLYSGSIEYHSLVSSQYWMIGRGSVSVNGRSAATGLSTIIDSGTTLMAATPSVVQSFYRNIPGSRLNSQIGLYTFPCDSVPEVAFSWGGNSWPISADK